MLATADPHEIGCCQAVARIQPFCHYPCHQDRLKQNPRQDLAAMPCQPTKALFTVTCFLVGDPADNLLNNNAEELTEQGSTKERRQNELAVISCIIQWKMNAVK